ncbi:radical SAM protein [Paramagnetospirillum caucaseum]|uniref:Radical SAM protein n=2 Tax=Paramagnetospirillum caucaseum TaxID=1244869 RepID=M3ACL8_9PROT|nr:radical SAM protein [Paramagnetospirillum caucaseum]
MFDRIWPQRAIRRVLLVTPPDADAGLFRFDTAQRGRYTNYPPYGLMLLAQVLRKKGIEVRILNLNHALLKHSHEVEKAEDFDFDGTWRHLLDAEIAAYPPDLCGVTCMFTMTHASLRRVCAAIAEAKVPTVVGGVHVTNDLHRILDDLETPCAAVSGEAEVAFPILIDAINKKRPSADLGQVVLNDGPGRHLAFNRDLRPDGDDLDTLPAYDLVPIEEYSRHGTIGAFYCFKPQETIFATALSNRGCRAMCTFCSVRNFNGKGVRQRSVSSVVDELEYLTNERGVTHVMWLDDDLLKDHGRAIELFNEMTRRNLNLTWDATNGVLAASCTDEVIAAAAASGCIAVNIGMESGNREILKSVRKPGTPETFLEAAEVLRRYESIHASVFLMIGFPGETMSMILDTINVARAMDLDWYRCSQLQPLPNTPLYDSMVAQGLIQAVDKDIRFNGGAYGKQTEIEQGLALGTPDFEQAFSSIPMDSIPTGEQLTDIWFFMNYHLNFHRIFHETRRVKIEQLMAHLRVLGDVISPENGFSLYFQGFLQYRRDGRVDPVVVERLQRRLDSSPYWRDRFHAFGLAAEDLTTLDFRNRDKPRILSKLKL